MLHSLKRPGTEAGELKVKLRKLAMSEIIPPVKSYSDKKLYRHIKLQNGLSAMLVQHFIDDDTSKHEHHNNGRHKNLSESEESAVSNQNDEDSEGDAEEEEDGDDLDDDHPKEKMAAVALCIRVGSFFDPEKVQGLSHFLEHMIFMGSEKYPKENEFDQYISNNGGSDNAMTECEYTMFYFEIVEEHLNESLDRFAQLFVSPLMLKDSMEREMEAVESEFQNNLTDDDNRIMQLCASVANGPASTFTWGNLKTLKDGITNDELYEIVHEFRRRHYIANRMFLCIESSSPLDDLQELIKEKFSLVKSGPNPEPLPIPVNLFKPEFYEKVFYVKPKADKTKLYITFLLPSMEKHYKSKPHDYLAYIIQHEGVGSLNSFLKKRLLSIKIEAGLEDQSFEGNSMFSLFSISVTLTEKGYENVETVLEAIFSFLLMLKSTPIEEHKKAYMELKQNKETAFKYREEKTATDNVEEIAVSMMYYEPEDILTGSELLFDFDCDIVQDLIDYINERRFNILFLTDKHERYDKIEKWFGTEYDEIDFPQSYVKLWDNRRINSEFSMPPPNEFICEKFDIIVSKLDSSTLPQFPEKIYESKNCECFYKLDNVFKLPHAFICLYFVSPLTNSSVRGMVLTSIYSMIVKHYMTEKLYPAICAGLGYQLYSEEKGMLLKLSGYDEKLPLLLDIITKDLKTIRQRMEENVFETYRKHLKKIFNNNLINSKFLNKDCRLNIVTEHHKFFYDRFNMIDNINFKELLDFSDDFLKQLNIQILVQGNVTKAKAMSIVEMVKKNLPCEDVSEKIESRTYKIPSGNNTLCVKSMLPNDKNSTITKYIQLGESTIRLQCLIEFVEKIMEEPLFDILRTQEQLGYSVSCSHRCNHGILGLCVSIQCQENKNQTSVVDERIQKFLTNDMIEILDKMSDEDFETFQNALIKLKNMVEVELESEVGRHWSEITCREYIFDRLHLEAQMIAQLTRNDVVEFYKTQIIAADARHLSIQVIGNANEDSVEVVDDHVPKLEIISNPQEDKNFINDMNVFKSSLELYPVTKTIIDLFTNN
ncbi:CLUMA_CG000770, isoform A [Clunio marinus]|uniref:CLUMA_CG000770, isoform A n=1 Tax=Clunio marinus TaxID=568069 RepID=A0A1J1HHB9_9DIPT|nr:CLUMA_CG000770, isoform A [Clunio marinus]